MERQIMNKDATIKAAIRLEHPSSRMAASLLFANPQTLILFYSFTLLLLRQQADHLLRA